MTDVSAFNPPMARSKRVHKELLRFLKDRGDEIPLTLKELHREATYEDGPTLLDHFAGQAMKSLITMQSPRYGTGDIAQESYDMAEAMLRERRDRLRKTQL